MQSTRAVVSMSSVLDVKYYYEAWCMCQDQQGTGNLFEIFSTKAGPFCGLLCRTRKHNQLLSFDNSKCCSSFKL